MKKIFPIILIISIVFSIPLTVSADTINPNISSSDKNSKTLTIVSNSNADYLNKVNSALSNGYDAVDVIFTDLINKNISNNFSEDINHIPVERSQRYYTRNVRSISDYTGKKRIASDDGTPGIIIKINTSRTVSYSLSGTFGASIRTISLGVGWNLSSAETLAFEGEYKVPKKIRGKYVKKAILSVYPKFSRKKYDVYYGYPRTRFTTKKGTGIAYKPIGVSFRKKIIYKKGK